MLLATLAAFALQSEANYFPLQAGSEWEYTVTFPSGIVRQINKALPPVKFGDISATPMEVWLEGERDGATYYSIENGYVAIVASQSNTLLPKPIPVLPVDPKKGMKWQYSGETALFGNSMPTTTKSEVTAMEKMNVLGTEVTTAKIMRESESVLSSSKTVKMQSTEWYAPGIGLVKLISELKSGSGGTTTYTLVRFKVVQP